MFLGLSLGMGLARPHWLAFAPDSRSSPSLEGTAAEVDGEVRIHPFLLDSTPGPNLLNDTVYCQILPQS